MAFLISKSKASNKGVFDSISHLPPQPLLEAFFISGEAKMKSLKKIKDGYLRTLTPSHPFADCEGYVRDSRLIAEKLIGHILKKDSLVHHINGIKTDNKNSNLVICENQAYHLLLHRRKEALDKSGHSDYKKCVFCKKYDNPINLIIVKRRNGNIAVFHRSCRREADRLAWPTRKQYRAERNF